MVEVKGAMSVDKGAVAQVLMITSSKEKRGEQRLAKQSIYQARKE